MHRSAPGRLFAISLAATLGAFAAPPATGAPAPRVATIDRIEVASRAPGWRIEIRLKEPRAASVARDDSGRLSIDLPYVRPGLGISTRLYPDGLVAAITVASVGVPSRPVTRLTVETRGEADWRLSADGPAVRLDLTLHGQPMPPLDTPVRPRPVRPAPIVAPAPAPAPVPVFPATPLPSSPIESEELEVPPADSPEPIGEAREETPEELPAENSEPIAVAPEPAAVELPATSVLEHEAPVVPSIPAPAIEPPVAEPVAPPEETAPPEAERASLPAPQPIDVSPPEEETSLPAPEPAVVEVAPPPPIVAATPEVALQTSPEPSLAPEMEISAAPPVEASSRESVEAVPSPFEVADVEVAPAERLEPTASSAGLPPTPSAEPPPPAPPETSEEAPEAETPPAEPMQPVRATPPALAALPEPPPAAIEESDLPDLASDAGADEIVEPPAAPAEATPEPESSPSATTLTGSAAPEAPSAIAAVPAEPPAVLEPVEPSPPPVDAVPEAEFEPPIELPARESTATPPDLAPRPASSVLDLEPLAAGEFRIAGDGEMRYTAFRLENPERFVIDVRGVVNRTPLGSLETGGPLVRSVRISQFRARPEPVTRVIFDLRAPAVPAIDRDPRGLTVRFGAAVAPADNRRR